MDQFPTDSVAAEANYRAADLLLHRGQYPLAEQKFRFLLAHYQNTEYAPQAAMGLAWIDRAVKRGTVVYVAAEGSSGLGRRIKAYADSHELAEPEGIHFIHEPVNLLEARDAFFE